MPFLSDKEITALIESGTLLAPDCESRSERGGNPSVKAGSLDLHIGDIFVPGVQSGRLGAHDNPRRSLSLEQGATAIVRTKEKVRVPDNHGGIAFPPARLSLTGLLTTNPGHLDPGYSGPLHLTLINMGKSPINLERGQRIVRVLFYRMYQYAENPYRMDPNASSVDEELLDSLSHDFLNVQERATKAAKKEVDKAQRFLTYVTPVIGAALALCVAGLTSWLTSTDVKPLESRLDKLEGRIGGLGGDLNLDAIETRLEQIEGKLGENVETNPDADSDGGS